MFTKFPIQITKESCWNNSEDGCSSDGWNFKHLNVNYSAVLSTGLQVSPKPHEPFTVIGWPSLIAWRDGGPGRTLSGVRASGVVASLELGLRPVKM